MQDSFSTGLKSVIQKIARNEALTAAYSVNVSSPLYSPYVFGGEGGSEELEHPIICGLTQCRFKTINSETELPENIQRCR